LVATFTITTDSKTSWFYLILLTKSKFLSLLESSNSDNITVLFKRLAGSDDEEPLGKSLFQNGI